MEHASGKLFFWTFTYRDVHSLKSAMRLWNEFLTILKRNLEGDRQADLVAQSNTCAQKGTVT
jgi:hypothetical protein